MNARHPSHAANAVPQCTDANHYTAHCAFCGEGFMAHDLGELNAEIQQHIKDNHDHDTGA